MKIIYYLFCLILLISCQKESEDFPKTYNFDSFETGEIRFFTNNGKINDSLLTLGLIDKWSNYLYNGGEFNYDNFDFKGKITLYDNNKSTINNLDSVLNYRAISKNGVIYFESPKTSYSFSNLINMKDPRLMFGPITQTSITKSTIYNNPLEQQTIRYGYLPCIYGIEEGNKIKFPFLNFVEKNRQASLAFINRLSNVNNKFNENYIINKSDKDKDTIVIQENFMVFTIQ